MKVRAFALGVSIVVSLTLTLLGWARATSILPAPDLRLGLVLPYTGPFASVGEAVTRGIELYLDSVGRRLSGRKVELIKEDTEAKPDVGLTKTRKLVERDRVDLLIGPVSSSVVLAMRYYVDSQRVPLLVPVAGISSLTRERASPYIFRTIDSIEQLSRPMAQWVFKNTTHRRFVIMASNYAAGHDVANIFIDEIKKAGGQVVQEIYPPLGAADFAPFLARVRADQADAVLVFFAGSDAIRYVTQFAEFGLKDRILLMGHGALTDDLILQAQGEKALNIITSTHYASSIDTPENKRFVKLFSAKYNELPNRFNEAGWAPTLLIDEALKRTGGRTDDKSALLAALRNAQPVTPRGVIKFDENNQVILNVYIQKVQKFEGKIQNIVIDVVRDVRQ